MENPNPVSRNVGTPARPQNDYDNYYNSSSPTINYQVVGDLIVSTHSSKVTPAGTPTKVCVDCYPASPENYDTCRVPLSSAFDVTVYARHFNG